MDDRQVLVVDGDRSVRGLIAEVLQDAGYTVIQAELGEQALKLTRERQPAVILVNHSLPDMYGLWLLRQIKDHPATRQVPTVLLSGRLHQLSDHDMSVADCVLALPFDIDVLERQVDALVGTTALTVA